MDVDAISSRQPGGIGRIGGVKAMHGAEPNSSARLSQIERLPTRPISDTIGEDKRPTDSSRNGKPSETAEERAHRHRAMLKHDLEEKRKIPVKKKRKF